MYQLYARPGSGSAVIEAVLAEVGAEHEVIDVERLPDRRPPAHLVRINPLGQVPALIMPNGEVMTESAAMVIHLCDLHPAAGLAPAVQSPQRAAYLRWLIFMTANIYMTDLRIYFSDRYSSDPKGGEAVKTAAVALMAREWQILANELGSKRFIVGDTLSAVDLYAAMLATWNLDIPEFFARHPNVKALYDRVSARPKIAAAWKRNLMPV